MELELTLSVTSDWPPPKGRSASAWPGLAFSPVPNPGVRLGHPPPCLTEIKQPRTARRRSAAERLAVASLELGLVDDAHRLAEVPARCREAKRSARRGSAAYLRDLGVRRVAESEFPVSVRPSVWSPCLPESLQSMSLSLEIRADNAARAAGLLALERVEGASEEQHS